MEIKEFLNGYMSIKRSDRAGRVFTSLEFVNKLSLILSDIGYIVKVINENTISIEGKSFTFSWDDICEYNYYSALKIRLH